MEETPLVSVFIVTYNSSDYILETLESVKAQSYSNIELVVSDDKSKDDTVVLVKKWLDANKNRFTRVELVEAAENTGTAGNYNRAVGACRGMWLKMLDGDDLLLEKCIEDDLLYIDSNKDAEILFTNYEKLVVNNGIKEYLKNDSSKQLQLFSTANPFNQMKMLLKCNMLFSSTCFIKASLLKSFPYDENYSLLEDHPMWIKLTKNGHKIYYFDKPTVIYRISDSVSNNSVKYYSEPYFSICKRYYEDIQLPLILKYKLKDAYFFNELKYLLYTFTIKTLGNRKNRITLPIFNLYKVIAFASIKLQLLFKNF